jgi:YD repeat-containing protein
MGLTPPDQMTPISVVIFCFVATWGRLLLHSTPRCNGNRFLPPDNVANVNYTVDGAGRLGTTTANGKTLSFQLDPAGNRTRTTWPDTSFYTTTSYDALNRPATIKELGNANSASYAYDDLSRRTTVTLGNNTTTSYGYDDRGDLSTLAHDLSGTAQDISYTYARNQAREITQHSWSNDAYQWAGVPGNATNGPANYTANGLNQYTSAAGDTLSYNRRVSSYLSPHSCGQALNIVATRMRLDDAVTFWVQSDCPHGRPVACVA